MSATEIVEFRRRNKLTQPRLGKLVGRTWRTVARWEAGTTPVPTNVLELLRLWEIERHRPVPTQVALENGHKVQMEKLLTRLARTEVLLEQLLDGEPRAKVAARKAARALLAEPLYDEERRRDADKDRPNTAAAGESKS